MANACCYIPLRRSTFMNGVAPGRLRRQSLFGCRHSLLLQIKLILRKEEKTEDHKRKQRKDNRNCIGRLNLAFVKLCKNIQRCSLRSAGKIPGHKNCRTELAYCTSKRQ